MLTLTDQLTDYFDVTHDDTAENKARGIRRINQLQRMICSGKDYWWLRKQYTFTTTASTQSYYLPVDFFKIESITILIGTITYTPIEINNPAEWDRINSTTTFTSNYPLYYFMKGNQILIYPNPSTSGNTVTITYIKKTRDLRTENYTTGTIAVTNNSATVTGTGTTWNTANNIRAGNFLFIDDTPYEVLTVGGTTSITLTQPYQGTTASGLSYKIGDCSPILDEFQDVLWKYAARDYFAFGKENSELFNIYSAEVKDMLANLIKVSISRTSQQVVKRKRKFSINRVMENIYSIT